VIEGPFIVHSETPPPRAGGVEGEGAVGELAEAGEAGRVVREEPVREWFRPSRLRRGP
jgi:hypothetical protein